ncbi:MAG: hypothetical protein HQM13_13440 [SAR324 cluster bacterium]|nr:hypothetical protein [SAR324 cluster bacterium]
MPIIENDPWRMQFFSKVSCPEDVAVPTDDGDAYELFSKYRWVYNKLLIAESQGFECGPHGVPPRKFPVFSKPIYNLRGMGSGSLVFQTREDYSKGLEPGHFWMPLLSGEHISSDVAVVDNEAMWWRHVKGKPLEGGMFDYWIIEAEARPDIEQYCGDWIRRHLKGFTGMINLETIDNRIIETHLRFSDQWPDLYGSGWLDALVELYSNGQWNFSDRNRRDGFSVVLFGGHGLQYNIVEQEFIDELLKDPEISSVQITFHQDKKPELHAMPPGGFRLAIVNCMNLEAGFKARERLALHFWSTQNLKASQVDAPQ